METCKEIVRKDAIKGKSIRHWIQIPSEETPGDYHDVLIFTDGTAYCDCKNTMFIKDKFAKDNCWHKRRAWEMVENGEAK